MKLEGRIMEELETIRITALDAYTLNAFGKSWLGGARPAARAGER